MFGTRHLAPAYQYGTRVGSPAVWAADGAPMYQLPLPGILITWPTPGFYPPLPWVMTERPQLTKQGFKSAANP